MLKSSAEYFLDRMLRTVGLTAHDVMIVPFMARTKAPLSLMPQALLDIESVRNSWPYLTYRGTLAADLIDVLVPVNVWVAKEAGRAARTPSELSRLIDGSVLREARTF